MSRTFSAEDEERLRQLHADGVSRNEIAQEMDWSVGTITNHAQRLGLSFDREATRAATEARQVDLKDQRQQAQQRLMDFFNRQLDRAQSRYLVHGFSHTGESVAEWLQEPPARETKDLTAAATQALDRALKLAQFDAEHDGKHLSAIDRFLQGVMGDPTEPDE
ncbi:MULTISPECIES: hypothetical protein [Streptomyces]|uniref:hypothetical protein n=1 Tax=Streptomyces TaxID=1883 RepID=UPI000CF2E3EB|nr:MULTISPECIES: hypothetical protein [Streptomyces]PPS71992.1 hypothetical protein BV882_20225 [Streptomyces sp. 46]